MVAFHLSIFIRIMIYVYAFLHILTCQKCELWNAVQYIHTEEEKAVCS